MSLLPKRSHPATSLCQTDAGGIIEGDTDAYVIATVNYDRCTPFGYFGTSELERTDTVNDNLNPVWNEAYEFELLDSDSSTNVELTVWDEDSFASDVRISQVIFVLEDYLDSPERRPITIRQQINLMNFECPGAQLYVSATIEA